MSVTVDKRNKINLLTQHLVDHPANILQLYDSKLEPNLYVLSVHPIKIVLALPLSFCLHTGIRQNHLKWNVISVCKKVTVNKLPYVPVRIFSQLYCTILYSFSDRIKYLIELFRRKASAPVNVENNRRNVCVSLHTWSHLNTLYLWCIRNHTVDINWARIDFEFAENGLD